MFGFMARLSPEKGPGMFIQAAAEVRRALPTSRFLVIGKPLSRAFHGALMAIRHKLGLDAVVRARVRAASSVDGRQLCPLSLTST